MGDAAACAVSGQTTPTGYYNLERMLKGVVAKSGEVGICGTCMEARSIRPESLVAGTHPSTLEELTRWTLEADKVIAF